MGILRAEQRGRRLLPTLPTLLAIVFVAGSECRAQNFVEVRMLILKNGRVVEGKISQNAGGYVVDLENGSMMVPRTQVLFPSTSIREAYTKLRNMMPRRSVKGNLILARWCLTNQLFTQARTEIREALNLDPNSTSAKRMMTRLEEMLDPTLNKAPKKKTTLAERILAPPVRSLAGLPRNTASQFVSKIQPILMNNCATSGCHEPRGRSRFKLSRVRLGNGGHRGLSERNLATVLGYVDPKSPDRSPLLTKPTGNHGRNGKLVFRGRAGARQLAYIRQWVRAVSASNESTGVKNPLVSSRSTRLPSSKSNFQLTPSMKAMRSQIEQRRVLGEIRSDGRKDVFDPGEFNKRTKLRERSSSTRRSTQGIIR